MPTTHQAITGETIYLDPGKTPDGPYTIDMPDPTTLYDGAFVRILPTTNSATPITVNGNGKSLYNAGAQQMLSSIADRLNGDVIELQFSVARDAWSLSGGLLWQYDYDPDIYTDTGVPTALTTGGVTLPMQHLAGGQERFSLASNTLTALADLPLVGLEADVLLTLGMLGNNTETQPRIEWVISRGGSGTDLVVPGLYPFQSSRAGDFQATVKTTALFSDVLTNDTITLQGSIKIGDEPVDAEAWLITIPESPRYPQAP